MYLDCELMHCEPTNLLMPKSKVNFKCISVYKGKINVNNLLSECVHEYVPIIFDEMHFNVVDMTFHANIFDFCQGKKNIF